MGVDLEEKLRAMLSIDGKRTECLEVLRKNLKELIALVCRRQGWNQRQLANSLGVSMVWLCRVKRSPHKASPSFFTRLSKVLQPEEKSTKKTV